MTKPHLSNPRARAEVRQATARVEREERQRARHTSQQEVLETMTEAQLQRTVIDLARSLGWGIPASAASRLEAEAAHYGVPAPELEGLIFHPRWSIGSEAGWPDLTLVRRRDRRLVWAELKSERGVLSRRQQAVLELLRSLAFDARCGNGPHFPKEFAGARSTADWHRWLDAGRPETRGDCCPPRIEIHVWRPRDLASGAIADVLR